MGPQSIGGAIVAIALVTAVAQAQEVCTDNGAVSWAGPFNGSCAYPALCPQGDVVAIIDVFVKDCVTGRPLAGVAAGDVEATGSCMLAAGAPCTQTIRVTANGPTDTSGRTTITVDKAGGCCSDLQVRVRGVTLTTLSYRSYDYTADLRIDLSDLGFLADTFNLLEGESGYNACFDVNCDRKVDLSDLGYFASHFGHSCL